MAAALVTGRSWCLYTTSVVRMLEWPHRVRDLLDGHAGIRQERNKGMAQLARRPVRRTLKLREVARMLVEATASGG